MTDTNLINDQTLGQYHEKGYFTVEGLFTDDEVEGVHQEITRIVACYPDVPKGLVQIEPSVASGENTPETLELGVRKLAGMAKHNAFFRNLAFHPKMVKIATTILGPDVKLHTSGLLMKPPHFGGAKVWHQDNAYFRLTPNHAFGFWVACDDATVDNGCMHIIPGSHTQGVLEHSDPGDEYGLLNPPSIEEALPIPLKTGDALIFHGEIFHYTPPNKTDRRRRAIQYHYSSSKCRRSEKWELHKVKPELLVAGRDYGMNEQEENA